MNRFLFLNIIHPFYHRTDVTTREELDSVGAVVRTLFGPSRTLHTIPGKDSGVNSPDSDLNHPSSGSRNSTVPHGKFMFFFTSNNPSHADLANNSLV